MGWSLNSGVSLFLSKMFNQTSNVLEEDDTLWLELKRNPAKMLTPVLKSAWERSYTHGACTVAHLFHLQPCVDEIKPYTLCWVKMLGCTTDSLYSTVPKVGHSRFPFVCGWKSIWTAPTQPCLVDGCIIRSLNYLNYSFYMVSHVKISHVCDMWRRA